MRRLLLPLLLTAALLAPAASLAAEPGWQRADAYYPPEPAWYGWQMLLVDALSIGAVIHGIDRDRTDYIVGGSIAFVLTGPTIHRLHGQNRAAVQSLSQRIGAPLTFGYVGLRLAEGSCADGDTRCATEWGLGGVAAGVAFAIVADLVLGSGDVAVAPTVMRDARGDPIWGMAIVGR